MKKEIKIIILIIIILFALIIGYFLGSILFEPDFGSLVRHESTLFLFYIELFYSRSSAKMERIVYED